MTGVTIRIRKVTEGEFNEIGSIIEGNLLLDDGEEIVEIQRPNPFTSFYVFTKTPM